MSTPSSIKSSVHYVLGTCLFVVTLIFLYFYFPAGFRAALIGGPLLLYSYFFGSQPDNSRPAETLVPDDGEEKSNISHAKAKNSILDSESVTPSVLGSSETLQEEEPEKLPRTLEAKNNSSSAVNDVAGKYLDAIGSSPGARAMAAAMSRKMVVNQNAKELVVLFGSQTGNAMEIAKGISAEASAKGIMSKAYALNDFPLSKLPSAKVAIFVVSSTGDGDPPDNCETFFNAIRRKSHPTDMLSGLQYTVLGLGDSNFTSYMQIPRTFTTRLPDLGAACFYKCGEADEVEGLEDVVEAWQAGLWEPLKAAMTKSDPATASNAPAVAHTAPVEEEVNLVGVPALQPCRVKLEFVEDQSDGSRKNEGDHTVAQRASGSFSAASPLWAPVTHAKYMTADWSDRKVVHLEVEVGGESFRPGDSVGVLPQNDEEAVGKLVVRLGGSDGRMFRVKSLDNDSEALSHIKNQPCDLRAALLHHVDITGVPKKGLLRMLAEYCSDTKEKNRLLLLSSRGGKEAYKSDIQEGRPGLLDLLEEFPSCKPDLAHLLDTLPPLVARYYSITNALEASPGRLQVAFSVVKMKTAKERIFKGVATNWLEKTLGLGVDGVQERVQFDALKLPVFVKAGGHFRPPDELESPVVMIGPGTGVAPFRGFLQERKARISSGESGVVGESWLFFGCRREDEDFIYKEDFEGFLVDRTLSQLVVAFSRAQEQKVYVQNKIVERSAEIGKLLLNPLTHVFVCGDGAHMAKDVHAALLKVLETQANKTAAAAIAHMNAMMTEKRYIRDIWS